jgi:hypothetical protein
MGSSRRWQVWSVHVDDERALAVREDAAQGEALADAERRNASAARIMPGGYLVFMALPDSQVPDLETAQGILADRIDNGPWKLWEVAPSRGRGVPVLTGAKDQITGSAATRNAAASGAGLDIVYMALPAGRDPRFDRAAQLLAERDGTPAPDGTAREQLLDPARARRALDTWRAILRETPDGPDAEQARSSRIRSAAGDLAAHLGAALADAGYGLPEPVPGHPLGVTG